MHAKPSRVTDLAESCLVSQDHLFKTDVIDGWSSDGLERGIVDLYARRVTAVTTRREAARQEALDRMVVTQPFGRPFTA
jgi:hypothetical protein